MVNGIIEIHLCDFGVALSGRSRSREILSNYKFSTGDVVVVDFGRIEAINHAFLNEMFSTILRAKAIIKVINAPSHCEGSIEDELRRLEQLIRT